MPIRNRTLRIALILAVVLALSPLAVLAFPRARAAVRFVPGFHPLAGDARVYSEAGGEGFAARVAAALPGAVAAVETGQSRPFRAPFRVYVPASHLSFTRHLGLPPDSTVAGIAFAWDVWVSPAASGAGGRDTPAQALAHELSHLHLGQQLGWWRRVGQVPGWFSEGLADRVARRADDPASRAMALAAFAAGRAIVPDATGHRPLPRGPLDYGVPGRMLHAQARMFIDYLEDRDPRAFAGLVGAVVGGARFDEAFTAAFGENLDRAWREFLESVERP